MSTERNIYDRVADRCSEYLQRKEDGVSNSTSCDKVSCVTCSHFESERGFCKIDLYDRIVRNHHLQEDA